MPTNRPYKDHILEFRLVKKPLNVSKNVFSLILIKKIESFIAYLSLFNIILRYFKELIFTQIYFFFSRINWRFGFVIICKVFLFFMGISFWQCCLFETTICGQNYGPGGKDATASCSILQMAASNITWISDFST
jgi:hypothetical protein